MRKTRSFHAICVGLLGALWAVTGLPAAGAQDFTQDLTFEDVVATCAVCHGDGGMGDPDWQAPRLAGQGAMYLSEQITHFAEGKRGMIIDDVNGQSMVVWVADLDPDLVIQVAEYYASLSPPLSLTRKDFEDETPEARGEAFYQNNCASCHGLGAEGADVLYVPNLAILRPDYVKRQIASYQNGWRGGHAASTRAKGMRQLAFQFEDDAELDDLIAYLAASRPASDE